MPRAQKSSDTKKSVTKDLTPTASKTESKETEVKKTTPKPRAIRFDGATVVEMLPTKPAKGFIHCRMSDGTTKHVPAELF